MRQTIDKIATYILRFVPTVLAFITPLLFLTITPDYFNLNKQYFIYILASISLIAYIARVLTRGKIHLSLSPSLLSVIGLVTVYIVSSVWMNTNPQMTLFGPTALIVSLAIIFITVTSSQKNEITITSSIAGLIAASTLLSVFAILQYFGIPAKFITSDLLKSNLFTPTGYPLNTLTFVLPIAVGTLGLSIKSKDWLQKPINFSLAIIMLIGAFLSLKAVLPQNGQAGLIILPFQAGWSIAVDTFKDAKTALVGTGPDSFANTFTRLRPAYLNLDNNLWSIRFTNSSSEALTVLTVVGLLGLVFFLAIMIKPLLTMIKKERSSGDTQSIFLISSMIISLIIFLAIPFSVIGYALIFVLAIAITLKLKLVEGNKIKDVQIGLTANEVSSPSLYHDLSDKPTQIQLPILPWVLAGASAVLLAVFWTRAYAIYASSIAINQAVLTVKSDPQTSYQKQVDASNLDPYNPYYKVNLSQTFLAISLNLFQKKDSTNAEKQQALDLANQSINQAKAAATLDPQNEQMWENFANISRQLAAYQVQGAIDWTLATYGQAIS
ncbi:MAG TPA: hypothetical protein VF837_01285, partial [Patescibacteria group bacterium]